MNTTHKTNLTAEVEINASIAKVWALWTNSGDIMQWNKLSDDWHNAKIENDLRAGGRFLFAMGLKDGSFSFDFWGTYDEVKNHQLITYTLDDVRKSTIIFTTGSATKLTEIFEPNPSDPIEMQQCFCQAVLDRLKGTLKRLFNRSIAAKRRDLPLLSSAHPKSKTPHPKSAHPHISSSAHL